MSGDEDDSRVSSGGHNSFRTNGKVFDGSFNSFILAKMKVALFINQKINDPAAQKDYLEWTDITNNTPDSIAALIALPTPDKDEKRKINIFLSMHNGLQRFISNSISDNLQLEMAQKQLSGGLCAWAWLKTTVINPHNSGFYDKVRQNIRERTLELFGGNLRQMIASFDSDFLLLSFADGGTQEPCDADKINNLKQAQKEKNLYDHVFIDITTSVTSITYAEACTKLLLLWSAKYDESSDVLFGDGGLTKVKHKSSVIQLNMSDASQWTSDPVGQVASNITKYFKQASEAPGLTKKQAKAIKNHGKSGISKPKKTQNQNAYWTNWFKGGKGKKGKGGKGKGKDKGKGGKGKVQKDLSQIQCYKCKKWGHYADKCWTRAENLPNDSSSHQEDEHANWHFVPARAASWVSDTNPKVEQTDSDGYSTICNMTQFVRGQSREIQAFLSAEANLAASDPSFQDITFLDTACSEHMSGQPDDFVELSPSEGAIIFGDGISQSKATQKGTRRFVVKSKDSAKHTLKFSNTILSPSLRRNLLCVARLIADGWKICFHAMTMTWPSAKSNKFDIIIPIYKKDNLFLIKTIFLNM